MNCRKALLSSAITVITGMPLLTVAQRPDPVHFTYTATKTAEKTYEIHLSAAMDQGWHIYSQVQPPEAIAQPTKIVFNKNPIATLDGKAKEIGDKERYEDHTAGIIQFQYKKVDFVQQVKLKAAVKTTLTGTVTYQTCTDEQCLPPKTVTFTIPVE